MPDALNHPAPIRLRSTLTWAILAALLLILHLAMLDHQTRAQPGSRLDRWASIRFPDEQNYYLYCAEGVAREGPAFYNSERILRSGPIPWLWLLLWNNNVLLARFANIALAIAGSLLVGRAAARAFSPRARLSLDNRRLGGGFQGLVAFALCAAGYQTVLFSGTVLSEPPTFFFACLLLFAAQRLQSSRKRRFAILAGAALAAATLTRPGLMFLPLIIAPVWWLALRKQPATTAACLNPTTHLPHPTSNLTDSKSRGPSPLRLMALLLLAYLIPTAACITRNTLALSVPRISNGFGAVMYLGGDLRTRADEPSFVGLDWQTGPISAPFDHMQTQGDRKLLHAAIDNIKAHPIEWLALIPAKIARTLIGGPNWHFMPADTLRGAIHANGPTRTWIRFLWWTLAGTFITTFGIAGLLTSRRSHPLLVATALSLIAYLLLLHSVSYALPRFGLIFYPALVLGTVAYFTSKRRHWLTALLLILSFLTTAYLSLYRQYEPNHLADHDSLDAFRILHRWQPPPPAQGLIHLDTQNAKPDRNSTLLLRISAIRHGHRTRSCRITLTPVASSTSSGPAPISFPILTDGREHLYRLGLGRSPDWSRARWRSLDISFADTHIPESFIVHEVILAN